MCICNVIALNCLVSLLEAVFGMMMIHFLSIIFLFVSYTAPGAVVERHFYHHHTLNDVTECYTEHSVTIADVPYHAKLRFVLRIQRLFSLLTINIQWDDLFPGILGILSQYRCTLFNVLG